MEITGGKKIIQILGGKTTDSCKQNNDKQNIFPYEQFKSSTEPYFLCTSGEHQREYHR